MSVAAGIRRRAEVHQGVAGTFARAARTSRRFHPEMVSPEVAAALVNGLVDMAKSYSIAAGELLGAARILEALEARVGGPAALDALCEPAPTESSEGA